MEKKQMNIIERKNQAAAKYILVFLCLAFLFPMICSIIRYHFVKVTNGYILCLLCYLCTGLTIFQYIEKNYIIDINIIFLGVFSLFYGIIVVCTDDYTLSYNFIFMIPIMLFSHFSIEIKDDVFKRFHILISIILFMITILMTIDTLILYPGASRVLASRAFTEYGYDLYVKRGTGGFEFVYAVTVLIPVGLYASMHTNKLIQIAMIFLTGIAIIMIMMSGYATAILLTLSCIVLSICTINKWVRGITIILLPVIIWYYLTHRLEIAEYINDLSQQFSSRAVTGHMREIANIISQKSSVDTVDRIEHYKKSIEAFYQHPLLGTYLFTGTASVSGHSTILDLLGGGGLICTVPYIGYCISWSRKVYRRLQKKERKYAWAIITIIFWLFLLLNPIFASPLIHLSYFSIASIILLDFDLLTDLSIKTKYNQQKCKYLK